MLLGLRAGRGASARLPALLRRVLIGCWPWLIKTTDAGSLALHSGVPTPPPPRQGEQLGAREVSGGRKSSVWSSRVCDRETKRQSGFSCSATVESASDFLVVPPRSGSCPHPGAYRFRRPGKESPVVLPEEASHPSLSFSWTAVCRPPAEGGGCFPQEPVGWFSSDLSIFMVSTTVSID